MYQLSAFDVLYIFGTFLAIVSAGILFFWRHNKTPDVKWLALSYLVITLALFVVFLLRTKLILYVPHFYRTGFLFALLYMPLSFLYVRGILTNKKPTKKDWWHALPVLIFIIDNCLFFFASGEFKVAELKADFQNPGYPVTLPHGMLLPEFLTQTLTLAVPAAYFFSQVLLLIRLSAKRPNFFKEENAELVRWILFYLAFQFLVIVLVFLFFLPGDRDYLFMVTHAVGVIMSMFITLTLFIHPDIYAPVNMPGAFPVIVDHTEERTDEEINIVRETEDKDRSAIGRTPLVKPLKNLSPKQINNMKAEVESFLQKEKPFLKHGYSLQQMANSLSYQLYQLSALINREYGINFNDLINKYRIDYAINIIKEGKFSNLNINGLADQCGFSNRNSFTKAFKKFVGLTPSEYFKESGH